MIDTSLSNKVLGNSYSRFLSPKIVQSHEAILLEDKTPISNTNDVHKSFTQKVVQSLQKLGLNTENLSTEVLETFSQNLYAALLSSNKVEASIPVLEVVNNLNSSDSTENSLKISGGTNLKYVIDFSEAELGDYLQPIMANIQTALENIGQYISSPATFNLKVISKHDDSSMLAQASTPIIETKDNPHDTNADTIFISDSVRGFDFNSETHDSTITVNLNKIEQMSFSGKPVPDKYDFTSIVTHEILHGLAFTGALGTGTDYKTAYDGLISKDAEGAPIFVGRHAKTANLGKPIPLSPESAGDGSAYYHVDIPNDLMAHTIKKGEVKTISALNLAMLQDMGISVRNLAFENPKLGKVYNTGTLLNLNADNALQDSFTNLTQSLNGVNLPEVDFKNFLTHFSNQNSTGSFFTVSV